MVPLSSKVGINWYFCDERISFGNAESAAEESLPSHLALMNTELGLSAAFAVSDTSANNKIRTKHPIRVFPQTVLRTKIPLDIFGHP
jgi:hypothetical protein